MSLESLEQIFERHTSQVADAAAEAVRAQLAVLEDRLRPPRPPEEPHSLRAAAQAPLRARFKVVDSGSLGVRRHHPSSPWALCGWLCNGGVRCAGADPAGAEGHDLLPGPERGVAVAPPPGVRRVA